MQIMGQGFSAKNQNAKKSVEKTHQIAKLILGHSTAFLGILNCLHL